MSLANQPSLGQGICIRLLPAFSNGKPWLGSSGGNKCPGYFTFHMSCLPEGERKYHTNQRDNEDVLKSSPFVNCLRRVLLPKGLGRFGRRNKFSHLSLKTEHLQGCMIQKSRQVIKCRNSCHLLNIIIIIIQLPCVMQGKA